jgi:hypothetical protein
VVHPPSAPTGASGAHRSQGPSQSSALHGYLRIISAFAKASEGETRADASTVALSSSIRQGRSDPKPQLPFCAAVAALHDHRAKDLRFHGDGRMVLQSTWPVAAQTSHGHGVRLDLRCRFQSNRSFGGAARFNASESLTIARKLFGSTRGRASLCACRRLPFTH